MLLQNCNFLDPNVMCQRNPSGLLPLLGLTLLLVSPVTLAQMTSNAKWSFCPTTIDIPSRPILTDKLEQNDIYLRANRAESIEGGVSTLTGNAELSYNQQQLTAGRIDYHQPEDSVDLQGNVNYWDNAVYLNSPDAHVELAADNGLFKNVNYWLLDTRGRGKADKVTVTAGSLTVGEKVDYTTCDPDTISPWNITNNVWKISAGKLTLNHDTDTGTARNVFLKVKNIPVFYTPYLSFPISDKRKSGFLMPEFGTSTRNGMEIRTPYYWNIAPDMDATITPRPMSNIGTMMMGEFRYLLARGTGLLDVEYLPNDSKFEDKSRNSVAFYHQQSFLDSGSLTLLYNRVSDQHYYEHFSSSILGTSIQFLEQSATASYAWNVDGHAFSLLNVVGNFQTVDRNLPIAARPYKRLPSTTLGYSNPVRNHELNYALTGKFDYFTRGNDISLSSVNGTRYDLAPAVSFPLNSQSYFVVPKAGGRYTQYSLNDNTSFSDTQPNRLLPFFSLDSGLFLERNTRLFDEDVLQTLEPRLYYLYVPQEDQTDLPVFDTGAQPLSYASLFYDNRFNGPDRIGDANQITLAATSNIYTEATGQYLGYLSLGQTYYLRDQSVTLPGTPILPEDHSPLISEFGVNPFEHLELRGQLQWDPSLHDSELKMAISAMYHPGPGKVLNLAYRDTYYPDINNPIREPQTDISFHWPIKPELSVVGKWNYAIESDRTVDMFTGIEYDSCCWGIRLIGRRFLSNIAGEFESGVFLQFELKGLAGMGEKTLDFLSRSIPGYEREF